MRLSAMLMIFLLTGPLATADTIFFKNGTRVDVPKTWEEDGKIKCEMYGSVVGYPKKNVLRVEKNTLEEEAGGYSQADFEREVKKVFAATIIERVQYNASNKKIGYILFKPRPEYFGTGDKVNKIMAIESARLFRNIVEMQGLGLIIPLSGKEYRLAIPRSRIEQWYRLDFAAMHGDPDAWRSNFIQKYDSKKQRAKFAAKFVEVKGGKGTAKASPGTNPVAAISRSKAKKDLKSDLAKRYPGKYSAQKMLLDAGMKAYDSLSGLPGNKINNEILGGLMKRYYPKFSAIKMLYENNIKAYRELQN